MGGSDFQAVQPYTYDDLPRGVETDFNLDHFSIEKDKDFVIPVLEKALSKNSSHTLDRPSLDETSQWIIWRLN